MGSIQPVDVTEFPWCVDLFSPLRSNNSIKKYLPCWKYQVNLVQSHHLPLMPPKLPLNYCQRHKNQCPLQRSFLSCWLSMSRDQNKTVSQHNFRNELKSRNVSQTGWLYYCLKNQEDDSKKNCLDYKNKLSTTFAY